MLTSLLAAFVLAPGQQADRTPGQLVGVPDRDGKPGVVMPLKHTAVVADVAGIASRVTVVQTFTNPSRTPIEAVYTFPLPGDSAVDRMRIKVGERIVEGEIKRAAEARAIYDAAKNAGMTAALLDQERPNIFTQSVANIMPGATVQVEISYVDMLDYENGEFEFSFPMVVGPRNTMNATDPDKISPPITPKGTRTGHDVSLTVHLDAGMSLQSVKSVLHAVKVDKKGAGKYDVSLSNAQEIPNRDFILKWTPAGSGVQEGLIAHDGTFCLTIVPPRADVERFAAPREVVFVMDQSGSQSGFPIEKSKELTIAMIDKLRPDDRFNVVTFTTGVNHLWPESMANTPDRVREAKQFVQGLQAGGGTNFLPPLTATMTSKPLDGRLKLIVFNTDGYVGDDFDILQLVQSQRLNARLFTFGIGNSVNRFLIDGMSYEGRGASEIVTLADDVSPAIARFLRRTQTPVLTDVRLDFEGGSVRDVTPSVVPDLFSDSPLVVFGKYDRSGPAKVTVSGSIAGEPWTRTIDVVFPAEGNGSKGIEKMWARRKLDDMVREDFYAGSAKRRLNEFHEANTQRYEQFAIANGIMSQWTSFVAVEKRVVNIGGRQRTVRVPIEMADGVSYEGIFGATDASKAQFRNYATGNLSLSRTRGGAAGGGFGGGGAAASGGVLFGYPDGLYRPARPMSKEELEVYKTQLAQAPETKLDAKLKDVRTGTLELTVIVFDWPEDWKKQLEALGFVVADSDAHLKVVFGTVDARKLLELAKLKFVLSIRPIEE
jgi:Ca-activated chloride channel family protein